MSTKSTTNPTPARDVYLMVLYEGLTEERAVMLESLLELLGQALMHEGHANGWLAPTRIDQVDVDILYAMVAKDPAEGLQAPPSAAAAYHAMRAGIAAGLMSKVIDEPTRGDDWPTGRLVLSGTVNKVSDIEKIAVAARLTVEEYTRSDDRS